MRNIKLTESEWNYLKGVIISGEIGFTEAWEQHCPEFSKAELKRKNALYDRAINKVWSAKRGVA